MHRLAVLFLTGTLLLNSQACQRAADSPVPTNRAPAAIMLGAATAQAYFSQGLGVRGMSLKRQGSYRFRSGPELDALLATAKASDASASQLRSALVGAAPPAQQVMRALEADLTSSGDSQGPELLRIGFGLAVIETILSASLEIPPADFSAAHIAEAKQAMLSPGVIEGFNAATLVKLPAALAEPLARVQEAKLDSFDAVWTCVESAREFIRAARELALAGSSPGTNSGARGEDSEEAKKAFQQIRDELNGFQAGLAASGDERIRIMTEFTSRDGVGRLCQQLSEFLSVYPNDPQHSVADRLYRVVLRARGARPCEPIQGMNAEEVAKRISEAASLARSSEEIRLE